MDSTGRIHEINEQLFADALDEKKRRREELAELARRVDSEGAGPLIRIPAADVERLKASTPEERRAWYAKKLAAKAERKRQRAARKEQRRR